MENTSFLSNLAILLQCSFFPLTCVGLYTHPADSLINNLNESLTRAHHIFVGQLSF